MDWRRLAPAAVLAPLTLWSATQAVVPVYLIAVSLAAVVGCGEFYRLVERAGHRPLWLLGLPLALGLAIGPALSAPQVAGLGGGAGLAFHLLALATLGGLIGTAFSRPYPQALADWALSLAGPLYLGGLLAYFPLLRLLPDGAYWVPVVLLTTWAADIAAYAVGRRWGRTKLAPTLSPGKSVEGLVGGSVGALAVGAVLSFWAPAGIGPGAVLGLALVVAIFAPIGDLVESFIKRQVGAKDASGLLLGHGGVMDRIDSLLATGLAAYYYLALSSFVGWR